MINWIAPYVIHHFGPVLLIDILWIDILQSFHDIVLSDFFIGFFYPIFLDCIHTRSFFFFWMNAPFYQNKKIIYKSIVINYAINSSS